MNGVQMLDTLQTVNRFKQLYSMVSILGSGYVEFKNFDYNEVEGIICVLVVERILAEWRSLHTAYGFDDDKFKYGLLWKMDRLESFCLGNRRDIEQIGLV
jgi:hypothetical protein